ncbi:MAG TPA: hypothetical protein VF203_11785 [Burkholderiales bacterium]
MRRATKRLSAAVLLAVLPMASVPAAVTGVTASPAAERVAVARTTAVALRWNVATNAAGTVTSPAGEFRTPGGALLGKINQPLSQTVTAGVTAIVETVRVPADVIERARREGNDRLLYRRSFTDGAAASGEIVLHIAPGGAAAFGVGRVALAFDTGEAARVAARGEKLQAHAELSYTGMGRLRALWEVAGPNPDAERPAWRPIGEVLQTLAARDAATFASPALPTEIAGFYLVRLRIAEPEPAFEAPIVRYAVRQE